jgi:prepilin-type N-terminal cleavage/methylation domain-containing protein
MMMAAVAWLPGFLSRARLMTDRLKMAGIRSAPGFTLVELMLVILLSAVLITGMVQIVSAASSSFRLQDNQAEVMENGRHAIVTISGLVRQAGFSPEPWDTSYSREGLTAASADGISSRSDRLVVRSWSDTNCFDNQNPVVDESGEPAFYLRESLFDLNSNSDLAHTCRYGPDDLGLVTQINHQGFIRNVDSFQALYGEDTVGDGQVDQWVGGGEWDTADRVLAVRLGLLLHGSDAVLETGRRSFTVLDQPYTSNADGRVRHLFEFTAMIRGNAR